MIKKIEMQTRNNEFSAEHLKKCYSHTFSCDNCGELKNFWIKRGIEVEEVDLPDFKCKNCGCNFTRQQQK